MQAHLFMVEVEVGQHVGDALLLPGRMARH